MMATDTIVLPRPTNSWTEADVRTVYSDWQKFENILSERVPIQSEKYRVCLQRGRSVIIEKMIELIINETYVRKQSFTNWYVLYWKDAPHFMAKFLQQLETVFTGDKEIKIREKVLGPAVEPAPPPEADIPLPTSTGSWSDKAIKILYEECKSAMNSLESNPAIISGKYKQCLQRGRNSIMEKMMEIIMDPENFRDGHHYRTETSELVLPWRFVVRPLVTILYHSEGVFTGDNELQIREKRVEKLRNKIIEIPSRASLVALVEKPGGGQKFGILKTYGEIKSFSAKNKFHLEVLQGKRLLNEKWAEQDETYELSGEAKAMLCMHLWSLMTYVGFSKYKRIWDGISKGWEECVSWGQGSQGTFWEIIQTDGSVPLRLVAEKKGVDTILDAYKDMERHFKGDSEHCLIHYEDAYYPKEHNPSRNY